MLSLFSSLFRRHRFGRWAVLLAVGLPGGCVALLTSLEAFAQTARASIDAIRLSSSEARTRVWIDLSDVVDYHVFQLSNPPRLVVDFDPIVWNLNRGNLVTHQGFVQAIRFGQHSAEQSRLVLDLSGNVQSTHSFFRAPHADASHRLVIELEDQEAAAVPTDIGAAATQDGDQQLTVSQNYLAQSLPVQRPTDVPQKPDNLRTRYTVVIDAGHGGRDPGAIGQGQLFEKNVTLATATALAQALNATGRYNAILTRDADVYIPLRERPEIGREVGGDLFISLHADSAPNSSIRGASVYTLSETASDRESAALAERENDADGVAGIEIADYPEEIRSILLDLSMRRTQNESSRFAELLVEELKANWLVLPSRPHRFAGFAVLSSADMPSVLVEMGYLTNASDVRLLSSADQRIRFVESMVVAIDRYFAGLGGSI